MERMLNSFSQHLITLAGGAIVTDAPLAKNFSGMNYVSVAGGLGYGVDYSLDGARHINFITGVSMQMPFPDALQEFKVETSGMTAQHSASAAVGGVTKWARPVESLPCPRNREAGGASRGVQHHEQLSAWKSRNAGVVRFRRIFVPRQ